MKVLWFINVPLPSMCQVDSTGVSSYGGHWLLSLFDQLVQNESIQLGVATAFPRLKDKHFSENGVNYYVIGQPKRFSTFSYRQKDLKKCFSILETFKPDIIHIHGSERFFGLLKVLKPIKIPTVVSMQGLLGPYSKFHNFFGSLTPWDIICSTRALEVIARLGILWDYKRILKAAHREKNIIRKVDALLGRTEWDQAYTRMFNPDAFYFHVGEILRPSFYQKRWNIEHCDPYSIIYTNAGHPRRGTEDLLEAVAMLKREFPEIKLRLAGTISHRSGYGRFIRKKIKKLSIDNCVEFYGYLNETKMAEALLKTHVFAITSYIENSPNSLAEAMLVGMPCITSYVGGIPSMVEHGKTGLFFPMGDITLLVQRIRQFFTDKKLCLKLGEHAHHVAMERHDPQLILNQLLLAYNEILSQKTTS